MYCNVGTNERIVRIIIGIIGILLAIYISPWFYILSLIMFLTALIGYCPLSHLFGINTCKIK